MSFVDNYLKSSLQPIHYITSKAADGDSCYYFLMCSAERIRSLQKIKFGMINFEEHGIIIASGYGTQPSEEVKVELLNKYGYSFVQED